MKRNWKRIAVLTAAASFVLGCGTAAWADEAEELKEVTVILDYTL